MTNADPFLAPTITTCPYCGVGCGVIATPDGNGGASIAGDPEHPANFGRLCSKGSALGETLGLSERLLDPMIRCSNGKFEQVAWTDALDHVANRLQHIIAKHGPGSVGFYLSGQLLTEDYYVANKLMKGFIGTVSIPIHDFACPRRLRVIAAPSAQIRCRGATKISTKPICWCWSDRMRPGAIRSCSSA